MTRANLDQQIDAYLAIREAVGLTNGRHHRLLLDFLDYAQSEGEATNVPLCAATAVAWASDHARATCGVRGRADRLMVVRGFLSFLAAIVPRTQVPPARTLAASIRRPPYVFSDDEMAALISAAARPNPRNPFRPVVLSMLLGLLARTGVRVAEGTRLRMGDVRLGEEHPNLHILQTKFQKSRIVPVHPTVTVALEDYLKQRREHANVTWSDLRVGDMVIVAVPPAYRQLVVARHYIGDGVPLLKRIVALDGDLVCEHEGAVAVDGRPLARALRSDGRGRPMPIWEGCRRLGAAEFFALMDRSPYSLDSRYFGPLPTDLIIGKARALWLF